MKVHVIIDIEKNDENGIPIKPIFGYQYIDPNLLQIDPKIVEEEIKSLIPIMLEQI